MEQNKVKRVTRQPDGSYTILYESGAEIKGVYPIREGAFDKDYIGIEDMMVQFNG